MRVRDSFSASVKKKLAERVSWKCSFPGCGRITIGPGHKDLKDTINLGEAAHINAASRKGPRYSEEMTPDERKSIDNAIWMCAQHAKMIDKDYTIYSAATIKQWKLIAEKSTYQQLQELSKDTDIPLTFISIGSKLIFEGLWKSAKNNNWIFEVSDFVLGDINALRGFSINKAKQTLDDYVIVETQGDGRKLDKIFNWNYIEGRYEIEIEVLEKAPRENPDDVGGDIALDDDGDLKFENGGFIIIRGIECAKQIISLVLSTGFGELSDEPDLGCYFSDYYWKFKENLNLLNRLLKLEIARLVSIPAIKSLNLTSNAPLNFINRIIEVEILSIKLNNGRIPVKIVLEWGNGEVWTDTIQIYIHQFTMKN